MSTILSNLKNLYERIREAEQNYARSEGSVKLLAVSKSQPISNLQQAIEAGQKILGENYVREALLKVDVLKELNVEWHFIGAIQANKTKVIAEHFSWVHTIDRLKVAERLNAQRPQHLPPLNVCIQVNIDDDPKKAGVRLNDLAELAFTVASFPHLKLRGLMTIPKFRPTFEEQRIPFKKLRLAFEELSDQGLDLDTLSMGMSADFIAAIAEGATIIRVGTALFGQRIDSEF